MAMMKYKNDAGEWVEVAPTNFMHQFKFEYINPVKNEDGIYRKYDLSPYVQKNSDFMLIMYPTCNTNRRATVYIHSDGQIREFNGAASYGDIDELDDIFEDNTTFGENDFTYDEETRIMTYSWKSVASAQYNKLNKALLIYAG